YTELFGTGTISWEPLGDVLTLTRRTDAETAVVVVNASDVPHRTGDLGEVQVALTVGAQPVAAGPAYVVAPRSGAVFVRTQ
ncbi:MAG: hypothetical protein AAGF99_19275, partial [Bacteroidota bacterium]